MLQHFTSTVMLNMYLLVNIIVKTTVNFKLFGIRKQLNKVEKL